MSRIFAVLFFAATMLCHGTPGAHDSKMWSSKVLYCGAAASSNMQLQGQETAIASFVVRIASSFPRIPVKITSAVMVASNGRNMPMRDIRIDVLSAPPLNAQKANEYFMFGAEESGWNGLLSPGVTILRIRGVSAPGEMWPWFNAKCSVTIDNAVISAPLTMSWASG